MRHQNENTFLAIQIETPEVLPHMDAIAATLGVDMLFADLSANMGLLGQMDHPTIRKVIQEVGEACLRHGKAGAINCSDPEERDRLWEMGYRFFNVASDFRFIRQGLDASMAEVRVGDRVTGDWRVGVNVFRNRSTHWRGSFLSLGG